MAVKRHGLLVGLLHLALQRDRWKQRAFVHLDLEVADIDAEHLRGDAGIFGQAEIDRPRQGPRQKAVDRRTRRQRFGLVADDAAEIRFGRDQVGLAVSNWVRPAASCASDCATSVRVTSPTLKRSLVCFKVCSSTRTLLF